MLVTFGAQRVKVGIYTNTMTTQVKSQAGCRRDPAIPTWDPGWEWRDPALVGGIPPFPPGTQM